MPYCSTLLRPSIAFIKTQSIFFCLFLSSDNQYGVKKLVCFFLCEGEGQFRYFKSLLMYLSFFIFTTSLRMNHHTSEIIPTKNKVQDPCKASLYSANECMLKNVLAGNTRSRKLFEINKSSWHRTLWMFLKTLIVLNT